MQPPRARSSLASLWAVAPAPGETLGHLVPADTLLAPWESLRRGPARLSLAPPRADPEVVGVAPQGL